MAHGALAGGSASTPPCASDDGQSSGAGRGRMTARTDGAKPAATTSTWAPRAQTRMEPNDAETMQMRIMGERHILCSEVEAEGGAAPLGGAWASCAWS